MSNAPKRAACAQVPVIDPAAFEEYDGLRESTLAVFTDAKVNTLLREFVDFVYTVCLEYSKYWPREPEGSFKHQSRAALADLRHLQGYVAMLAEQHVDAALEDDEERLSRLCGRLAPRLAKIGDALERELGPREEE